MKNENQRRTCGYPAHEEETSFALTWHRAGNAPSGLAEMAEMAESVSARRDGGVASGARLFAEADIKWVTHGRNVIPYVHHGTTGLWLARSQADLDRKVRNGKALMVSELVAACCGKNFGLDLELKNGLGQPEEAVEVIAEICKSHHVDFRLISSSYDLCRAAKSVVGESTQVGFLSLFVPLNSLRLKSHRVLHFPKRRLRDNLSFGLYPGIGRMSAVDYIITSPGPMRPGYAEAVELLGRYGKGFCPGPVRTKRKVLQAMEDRASGAFVYMPAVLFAETLREILHG